MRRRRLLLFLLAGAVVGVVVWLAWPREREPEYKGRKFSEWILCLARSGQIFGPSRAEAFEAFTEIGTNGLPWAVKWLRYRPRPWRTKMYAVTSKWPRPFTLRDESPNLEAGTWIYLNTLGTKASPAIPELTHLMNDPRRPSRAGLAAFALCRIGPAALPPLLAEIDRPRSSNRLPVVYHVSAMLNLGTNAGLAVATMARCVSDPDKAVADAAVKALGYWALEPDQAVPALAKALEYPSREVRYDATAAIRKFQSDQARPAIPSLLSALNDSDELVRSGATNALRQIAPEILLQPEPFTGPDRKPN